MAVCAVLHRAVQVAYGSNIATFPAGGHLHVSHLTDVAGKGAGVPGNYAAFGVAPSGSGKVAVFSDTNCLDSSHNVSGGGQRQQQPLNVARGLEQLQKL